MHGVNTKVAEADQKELTGVSAFVSKQKYRVLIPCKDDPEKYLELYDILGRTYFPNAAEFS